MILNPNQLGHREKQILAGLFLSKFDNHALNILGFESFTEAFNALGYGLSSRPASIKNYRDEFDPLFPNKRLGWHKRERREYCVKMAHDYENLPLESFAHLVASFVGTSVDAPQTTEAFGEDLTPGQFAKRLITGKAAEQYFQRKWTAVQEFESCELEDTTSHGCGYDFRLWPKDGGKFKAVEVKGLADQAGSIQMTAKEHACAKDLKERFYLFVVKNFRDKPFHQVHSNPLAGPLAFECKERLVKQISWSAAA